MAETPRVCDTKPLAVEVEPGKHFWCSCGRSSRPPFCDGSHKGSGLQPVLIEVAETTTIHFCQCKRTGNPPHCDGSHRGVTTEEGG